MFSVEKCRKIDPSLNDLTDDEVIAVMENLYEMAQLAMEDWDRKRKGSKNP